MSAPLPAPIVKNETATQIECIYLKAGYVVKNAAGDYLAKFVLRRNAEDLPVAMLEKVEAACATDAVDKYTP